FQKIKLKECNLIIASGIEVISDLPVLYHKTLQKVILSSKPPKNLKEKFQKIVQMCTFELFKPSVPSFKDSLTNKSMGSYAEIIAKTFNVTREDQDQYALESHKKATYAMQAGLLSEIFKYQSL
ncbi:MAG: hypothetical protein MHPSP_001474, partial [Paramarteilia canceri]